MAAHRCPVWARAVIAGTYLLSITWLSLTSSSAVVMLPIFPGADKIAHFLMYGGLAVLVRWMLRDAAAAKRTAALALAGTVGYGVFMEILQFLCTHGVRTFSPGDMAANAAGAVAFWCISGITILKAADVRVHLPDEHLFRPDAGE